MCHSKISRYGRNLVYRILNEWQILLEKTQLGARYDTSISFACSPWMSKWPLGYVYMNNGSVRIINMWDRNVDLMLQPSSWVLNLTCHSLNISYSDRIFAILSMAHVLVLQCLSDTLMSAACLTTWEQSYRYACEVDSRSERIPYLSSSKQSRCLPVIIKSESESESIQHSRISKCQALFALHPRNALLAETTTSSPAILEHTEITCPRILARQPGRYNERCTTRHEAKSKKRPHMHAMHKSVHNVHYSLTSRDPGSVGVRMPFLAHTWGQSPHTGRRIAWLCTIYARYA